MEKHEDLLIALTVLAALPLAGCYRFTHPIPTMRVQAAEALQCDEEIELVRMHPATYNDDEAYRASGCGQSVWYSCHGEGPRFACERRGGAVYATPAPAAPQAVVKVGAVSHDPLPADVRMRRHSLRIDDALVTTMDQSAVRAVPVAPGAHHFSYESTDVDVVRELRPFTWTSESSYSVGNYRYTRTQYHTGLQETSTPVDRATCRVDFGLEARPGVTYRVLYERAQTTLCRVLCLEERPDGQLVPCTGFTQG